MSLKIGEKVTISQDMSVILRRRYQESYRSIDFSQQDNIFGRADFSGRKATITNIIEKSYWISGANDIRTKYVLNISKSQIFDEEFLIPLIKPVIIPFTIIKSEDNIYTLSDCEKDTMDLNQNEIETLVKSELKEGIFGNIEVRYIDDDIFVKKLDEIITLKPKDLLKINDL